MIIAFLVFKAIKHLNIAVEVGFVVGTIAEITPIGSATFVIPLVLSSSKTPQVFMSLYWLYIYSAAKLFFITLSSTIPIPVSSTAILASLILLWLAAKAACLNISSTCS